MPYLLRWLPYLQEKNLFLKNLIFGIDDDPDKPDDVVDFFP